VAIISWLSLGLLISIGHVFLLLESKEVFPHQINEVVSPRHEVPLFGFAGLQTSSCFFHSPKEAKRALLKRTIME